MAENAAGLIADARTTAEDYHDEDSAVSRLLDDLADALEARVPMRTNGLSIFDCFPGLDTVTITQGEVRKRLHQWERLSAWYQTDRKIPLESCPTSCALCFAAPAERVKKDG